MVIRRRLAHAEIIIIWYDSVGNFRTLKERFRNLESESIKEWPLHTLAVLSLADSKTNALYFELVPMSTNVAHPSRTRWNQNGTEICLK